MSELTTSTPLQGKRVLVTRTRNQASVLSEQLRTLGAIPIEFPTIRIVPPDDWTQLDAALNRLYTASYDWLIFTSVNGVQICCERLQALGYDPRDIQAMQRVRIATIGPATAKALEHFDLTSDLVPDEYRAEGVTQALLEDAELHGVSLKGQRILLARAAEARKILVTELQQAGALVDEVPAYFTHQATSDDAQGQEVWRLLQQGKLDILTFTSSSTVRNFVTWLESIEQTGKHEDIRSHLPLIACIGPITAQTARELGLQVNIEAKTFTIDGLVEAIIEYDQYKEKAL